MLKIVNNKATLWCAVILFIFAFSAIVPAFALGANYTYATTTVSTSATQNTTKVVIQPQNSMFATTQIQSKLPGNFSMMDYDGNPIGSSIVVPNSTNANLYYPLNVGTNIQYTNPYPSVEKQKAYYINIANNSNSFGDYSVSLVTDKHNLAPGQSINFFFNTSLCEVDLAVNKAGLYQIWYNNIIFNSINIESPSQISVGYVQGSLPDVSYNSASTGQYFYFMATEKGTYQIYLTSSSPYVELRCKYQAPTPITFGQEIKGGVDISSPNFTNPQYSLDVYSFSAQVSNYYTYFLQYDYGSPNAYFFYSTPSVNNYETMNPSTNWVFDPKGTGTVYVVIDNPAYYSWNYLNVKIPAPIKYTLKLNQIVPTTYQPNNGDDLIMVGPTPGGVAKTMDISQTSVMSMQFKDVGEYSPAIYDQVSSPYWEQIVDGYPQSVQTYHSVNPSSTETDINYLLAPGTYKILFYYQASGQNEYMQINSVLTPVSNTSVIVKNVTTPLNLKTDYTDFTLQNWGNQSVSPGYSMGNALTFGVDTSFRNYGYNITLDPSKNPSVFNQNINPDLGFLYQSNGSFYNYTNEIIPGNGLAVPFKTNDTTAGDMFYIGSYDKFSSITVDLSKAASPNSFYWQYCDYYYNGYADWVNFSPSTDNFTDETNNNGTLRQSGIISWNSSIMSNWAIINSNTNYTGTHGAPDTMGRNFYLIRAVCNNSASNIPTITSVNLKKFVTIEFNLNAQLGFDTQAMQSHYFDPTTGSTNGFDTTPLPQLSSTGPLVSVNVNSFGMNTNMLYKTGFLFFSGYNWYNLDYNGSTVGTQERLNQSLTFSVSLYRLDNYKQFEYNMSQNIPTVSSDQLNMTTYNGYDAHYSYNASTYQYIYIKIDPRTQYDWSQLNVQVQNGTLNGEELLSPFNDTYINLETDNYNSMGNSWKLDQSFTNSNLTTEFGFVTNYMLLRLQISSINPGALTTVNVFAGQYNYPFLTISSVQPPTPWQWWYTLLIVLGAVAIGLAVTYIVYKKKNPMFSLRDGLSNLPSRFRKV